MKEHHMPAPHFTNKTLAFLRKLKRHNERDWFLAHREQYESDVRSPMVTLIERLAVDLKTFAPDLVATPKTSIYRIYRDTRFSSDKTPFKTHVSAIFPHRRLTKHGGAGLYFHVATDHVLIGAGIYAPEPRQLYQLRQYVSANLQEFRSIVESPTFRRSFGEISGQRLQRVPRGFATDDPAAEHLKLRQFMARAERPAEFATQLRFYHSLKRLFEQLAPFVRFLNEPLTNRRTGRPDPLLSL
jgi:uncharacterized protein (TIGR02453 family)